MRMLVTGGAGFIGGAVVRAPRNLEARGRFAAITDPQGALLALTASPIDAFVAGPGATLALGVDAARAAGGDGAAKPVAACIVTDGSPREPMESSSGAPSFGRA